MRGELLKTMQTLHLTWMTRILKIRKCVSQFNMAQGCLKKWEGHTHEHLLRG